MSDPRRNSSPLDPLWTSFMQFWGTFLAQANEQAMPAFEALGLTEDPATWRRKWLEAASQSMEAYLRSPAFLHALGQNLRAMIQARRGGGVTTPNDIVFEAGSRQLLHFHGEQPSAWAEPVLVCFALVNRPYIVDLQPDRSVIRQLLRRGLDVYLIDWGTPTAADSSLRLHDYICRFLKEAVDAIRARARVPQLHLLGYCMGGTMSTMFTALYPEQVRSLILMAAPIDFSSNGLLNLWTRQEYFDVDALVDAFGNCPGWLLQICFQLMKPVQNLVEKHVTLSEKMGDEAFLESFFAMERWANDVIPVAGETFRDFVKMLYQQNLLARGEMHLREVPIDLHSITCPVLMLTADHDHLVPPDSTRALERHVGSHDVSAMSIDAGHIGLAVSSKAHQRLWPDVADWIACRSTACRKDPPP